MVFSLEWCFNHEWLHRLEVGASNRRLLQAAHDVAVVQLLPGFSARSVWSALIEGGAHQLYMGAGLLLP